MPKKSKAYAGQQTNPKAKFLIPKIKNSEGQYPLKITSRKEKKEILAEEGSNTTKKYKKCEIIETFNQRDIKK